MLTIRPCPASPSLDTEKPRTLPDDLIPLGARDGFWPTDEPLEYQACRTALWYANGNVTKAAKLLSCAPGRLANLVKKDPDLARERSLAAEMMLDRAEAVMLEALDDEAKADAAARWILEHGGRARGWARSATDSSPSIGLSFGTAQPGTVSIRWQNEPPMKTIDHE